MFDNIGSKIKTAAQVVCWIGIACSVILGIILMAIDEDGSAAVGFLIMILGSLSAWLGSFMTYGFGQLIENTDILVAEKRGTVTNSKLPETLPEKINTLNKWKEQGLISEEEYQQKLENLK